MQIRVKFPGRPVPNPSTIKRQSKRFKGTKNKKVNRWRHVLTEETLDDTGERLEHTLQKSLTGVPVLTARRATKLLELHVRIVNIQFVVHPKFARPNV